MDKFLNKEQLEYFALDEKNLEIALKYSCKGATDPFRDKELAKIYFEVTGEYMGNWKCSSCVLNNYKNLARLYYASKEHLESKPIKKSRKKKDENI